MAKEIKRKQHYVPRLYLRRFASVNTCLYVFDKTTGSSFVASIENVAREPYFYDVPAPLAEKYRLDPQMAENALMRFEGQFNLELERFIAGDKAAIATLANRVLISQHIVIQYLRTRQMRSRAVQTIEAHFRKLCEEITVREFGEENLKLSPIVKYDDTNAGILLCDFLFDRDKTYPLVMDLFSRKWIVGVNNTSLPTYTSDAPVVFPKTPAAAGPGISPHAGDIVYPLTPNLILIMTSRKQGEPLPEGWDNTQVSLGDDEISLFNKCQYYNCHRQLYSATGEFSAAEALRRSTSG